MSFGEFVKACIKLGWMTDLPKYHNTDSDDYIKTKFQDCFSMIRSSLIRDTRGYS